MAHQRPHQLTAFLARRRRNVRSALIFTIALAAIGVLLAEATQPESRPYADARRVDISTDPTSLLFDVPNMAPGDKVTVAITVYNNGQSAFRYAIRSTTTENSLAGMLRTTVKVRVRDCSNAGFNRSGGVIHGIAGDIGNTSGLNLVGNPAAGQQRGDRILGRGQQETLCFQVLLPKTTWTYFQEMTTRITLQFIAEEARK